MQLLLENWQQYLEIGAQILAALVIFATALVRVPGLNKHSEKVGGLAAKIFKAIKWLPTIGVNPGTKKLEEAYDDMKVRQEILVKKVNEKAV